MTDNSNTESVDINDNLDAFEAAFYNEKETVAPEEPVEDNEEEVEDTSGDDAPANDTDEDASEEDESEDHEEDQEEDEEPKPEPKGKKKKSDAQERISELTRKFRQEEREKTELLRRLEALEAQTKERETPIQERLPQGAPTPDAVDAKGELVYPLGEFDPKFIKDLTEFTIEQKTKALEERRAQEAEAAKAAAAQAELINNWNAKLEKAEAEKPDIREHIADLVDTIQSMNVDPAYGDYLAATIMQCDNGPDILEYLSENIGEAQKIVASGPAAATLAIGKLEARLAVANAKPNEQEKRNIKIPTSRTPPPASTKGRGTRTSVRGDTDNLDDFEKAFYG